ncbi:MAG: FAD-dependent oxidoreductase [Methylotenera sp.]|nr:FAD-dependent oxidoreductase [Methylotenera sp.]
MSGNDLFVDVAIVGAGLVGLSAAVALHQSGYSVALIDSSNPAKNNCATDEVHETWDARIYAISPKNAYWLQSLGVWQDLNTSRIVEMHAMEIFADENLLPLTLSADDANADNLGYIVESSALMQVLLKRVESLGIKTYFDSPCDSVIATPSKATLRLTNKITVESSLLLAADGNQSWVRRQLNFHIQKKSYNQTAIVANFKVEKSHENVARQWFSQDAEGSNNILAWLPLPDHTISIVWSVSTKSADLLLKLTDIEFTNQVMSAGGAALGDLKLISPILRFPLSLQKTSAVVQDCVVLVGDAAHQVHPMAGQGVNLGFRDVLDLVNVVKEKNKYQALNDISLLKHYTRLRKADFLNMLLLTDGLFQLFGSRTKGIKNVRNWGFSATKRMGIKKILVSNAISL